MEKLPFYRTKKFLLLIQFSTYVAISMLIVGGFYPGELSVLSGLLIPGLFLTSFFSEIFALILSGAILTLITILLSRKGLYIIVFFAVYYLATFTFAYIYMGAFV